MEVRRAYLGCPGVRSWMDGLLIVGKCKHNLKMHNGEGGARAREMISDSYA